ncbi:Zn(II)2Cys6 transcription factor [Aspergillus undulatus]|uniref:Zn(II)2Cys6 transcription factor n=1 Tax=Aspergillus undulatus TaxID=1810928 RepID=UPI003CCD3EB3
MPESFTKASSSKRPSQSKDASRYILPDSSAGSETKRRGVVKEHRRSRSGCFTCRLRRKKCDEERPTCQSCSKLGLRCDYKTPQWWSTTEQRNRQRDRVKDRIRQTKVMEKEGSLRDYMDRIKSMCQQKPTLQISTPQMGNSLYVPEQPSSSNIVNPYPGSYTESYVEPCVEPYNDGLPTPVSATSTSSMTSFIPLSITPFNFENKFESDITPPVSATSTSSMTSFIPPSTTPFNFETEADPPYTEPYTESLSNPVSATSTSSMTSFIPPAMPSFNFESEPDNQDVWPTSLPIPRPYSHTPTPTFNQVNQINQVHQVNQFSQPSPAISVTAPTLQLQTPAAEVSSNEYYNPTTTLPATPSTLYPSQTQLLIQQQQLNHKSPYAQGYGSHHNSHHPPPLSSRFESMIPINESDRPLLNHFVDNVIPIVFPMSEALRPGSDRFGEILNSLKTNKSYMHCCLSVSAIHLKTSMGLADEMDYDIVSHRYEAIKQLSRAHKLANSNKVEVMNASLAMIVYNCFAGTAEDYLPDCPWHAHFRGASNIVRNMHCAPSRFNVSLIAWVDILGATMLGETPQFAHTYRNKHLRGVASGLKTLMGCDDRIMYLISEIACLESLKKDKQLDDFSFRHHANALSSQLDWTEPLDGTMHAPFNPNGTVIPDMLVKIVTTLFRTAARIYLQSLLPTFDPYDPSIINLVTSITDTLKYIPAGIHGFDRALVWPLFMAGAHAIPASQFRKTMAERVTALGYLGDFGSFGRMYRVLKAIWRVADSQPTSPSSSLEAVDHGDSFNLDLTQAVADPETISASSIPHWRDVMRQNKWDYLLM